MTRQTIQFDVSTLDRALRLSSQQMDDACAAASRKIKDEWTYDATNEAPMKTGNLRDQINGTSSAQGIFLRDNAVNDGFNYSYYIHEVKGNDYIDRTFNEAKSKRIIEDEIKRVFREAGF